MQQERTKLLLSKLLTIRMLAILNRVNNFEEYLWGQIFIDIIILSNYIEKKELPTAREVAESCGTSEQQASRTINRFFAKLRENEKLLEILEQMSLE